MSQYYAEREEISGCDRLSTGKRALDGCDYKVVDQDKSFVMMEPLYVLYSYT